MHKPILILFIVFGFILFTEDIFGQEVYKSVDEKGTINFSDRPTSPIITTKKAAPKQDGVEVLKRKETANRPLLTDITTKKEAAKQDGAEVLKRNEMANRPSLTDSEIKAVLLTKPTWRGTGSSVRTGTS